MKFRSNNDITLSSDLDYSSVVRGRLIAGFAVIPWSVCMEGVGRCTAEALVRIGL